MVTKLEFGRQTSDAVGGEGANHTQPVGDLNSHFAPDYFLLAPSVTRPKPVVFDATVDEDGETWLSVHYALGHHSPCQMALLVNGVQINGMASFVPTGGWANWKTFSHLIPLQVGQNRIELLPLDERVPQIGVFYLGAVSALDGAITLLANDLHCEGVVLSDCRAPYVAFDKPDQQAITMRVRAQRTGKTVVSISYALGDAKARSLALEVNGTRLGQQIDFTPTGSWSTWDVTSIDVALIAGENELRLVSIGQAGPRIDLVFLGDDAKADDPGLAVPSTRTPTGSDITWTIESDQEGVAVLDLRCAHSPPDAQPMFVQVNGVVICDHFAFDLPGEDGWALASFEVFLFEGVNQIGLDSPSPGAIIELAVWDAEDDAI